MYGVFRDINSQDLSNFLFAFGLAQYKDEDLIKNITEKLITNQPFNIFLASRNWWALTALGLYSPKLFNKFEKIIEY